MKKFLILLKYGLSGSSAAHTGSRRKRGKVSAALMPIIASTAFGIPMILLFGRSFYLLKDVQIAGTDLATFLVSMWSTVVGVLFLGAFVPSFVTSFLRNEEVLMLLTLPVKKSAIVLYQMILTLMMQSITVVMYLFTIPTYAVATGKNFLLSIISALLAVLLVLCISLILSIFLGKWMNRSLARRISMIVYIIAIVLFLAASQLLPRYAFKEVNLGSIEKLTEVVSLFTGAWNVFSWPVMVLQGEYLYLVLLIMVSALLWVVSMQLANSLDLGTFSEKVSTTEAQKIRKNLFLKGFYMKDARILLRIDQAVFMFIYPIAFAFILGFSTKSFLMPVFLCLLISTFYVSILSGTLLKQEFLAWPVPLNFPVTSLQLILPKIIVPTTLFSCAFLAVLLAFKIAFNLPFRIFWMIPVAFSLYSAAAMLGLKVMIKERNRVDLSNPSKVMSTANIFAIEGIVLALAFASILPLQYYMFSRESLLNFVKIEALVPIVGIGAPTAVVIAIIIYLVRNIKKIALQDTSID